MFYATQTGKAKKFSEILRDNLLERNVSVSLVNLSEYDPDEQQFALEVSLRFKLLFFDNFQLRINFTA